MSGRGLLITGGTGRLGRALRERFPEAEAPPRAKLDLTLPASVQDALDRATPELVVHAAAFTDVARAETDRAVCWAVNVDGTRHLAAACRDRGIALVHISTDYVFDGYRGGYTEIDPLGPAINYYALTKIAAEAVARVVPRHLVIRTSFREGAWPHPVAFHDLVTSQAYLDELTPDIALAIERFDGIPFDTVHIAGSATTAFDLARRRSPEVEPASRTTISTPMPADISLDTSRWRALKASWEVASG